MGSEWEFICSEMTRFRSRFFLKISATTQLISDHLEITSVLKFSHSITLGINLEGFDSILGIGGCFHDLGEHFGA